MQKVSAIVALLLFFIQLVFTQNVELSFDTNGLPFVKSSNNMVSSNIKHVCYENGQVNYTFNYRICSSAEGTYIRKYGDYYNRYLYYAKDTIVIIDFVNGNFIFGRLSNKSKYELNKSILAQYVSGIESNLSFLFYNAKGCSVFVKETDTVLAGEEYKLICYKKLVGYDYDFEKQIRGNPIYSHVSIFFPKGIKLSFKAVVKEDGFEDYEDVYEVKIIDVDTSSIPEWAKNVFDKKKSVYKTFTFFDLDKKQIPASEMGKKSTDTMTEKLLHYPLVNSRGDTTSLNDFEGWVLLDFWIFGCRPCTEFHKRIQQEREKTGKILFKDMGIDILTIYILGGNTQTFRDYVSAYNIADISYAARDISLVINTPSFPRYFLVSPDKQIVYISDTLSDYSALLQAKKEYEQKHRSK